VKQHRIVEMEEGYFAESYTCPRCKGKGYHHGFGEHGYDPDWCESCGGPGDAWRDLLTPPET